MKILQEKQSPPLYPQSVKSSSPPTHKTYVPSIRSPDRAERTELSHMGPSEETRSEIAFFDVETTVPRRPGQGHAIVEFGAILVCPQKLVELHSYSTLVRPSDISLISSRSVRCNGISRDAVLSAPTFGEIADAVYDILHGRIWAGHNILRFDCARIREAFAEIGRPAPEPKGTIDSLALLTQRFGRRAGDMKMATLATYFGLGQQTHRSLDDVRMNLEVVKYCATVLFLESSLPDIFTANSWVSPNATTRSRRNGKLSPTSSSVNDITPVSGPKLEGDASFSSSINERVEENHPISSLVTGNPGELADSTPSRTANPDSFDMSLLSDEMKTELIRLDSATEEEKSTCQSPYTGAPPPPTSEGSSGFAGFLEPEEISIPLLSASLIPYYRGTQRIRLLHNGVVFQLCSSGLRVRFSVKNFGNDAGRPKLSFVVDATPILCQILEACDAIAQKLSVESGSSSEWKPLVTRKNGFINSPTVRLHVPTVNADGLRYETEIYRKESSGAVEKLMFSQCNTEELNALISTGTFVDTYFSLDPYDYHENAGIRAVTKKLFICSKQSN